MSFLPVFGLVILEGLDLALDWGFFAHISTRHNLEPFHSDVYLIVLVFCVIGSITFVIEIYLKCMEISIPESNLTSDVFSVATMWLEDLPQIAIGVYVAMTVNSHLSLVQYIKAVYAIFEAVIRLGMLYCRNHRQVIWTKCVIVSHLFCFFSIILCSLAILSTIVF